MVSEFVIAGYPNQYPTELCRYSYDQLLLVICANRMHCGKSVNSGPILIKRRGGGKVRKMLTKKQRSSFEDDGIVKLPAVIEPAMLGKLNAAFDWSIANPGPFVTGKATGENVHLVDNANPEAYQMYSELVIENGIGHVAAQLWSSDYVGFFAEEVYLKKGKSISLIFTFLLLR